jgi:hypothetical protein
MESVEFLIELTFATVFFELHQGQLTVSPAPWTDIGYPHLAHGPTKVTMAANPIVRSN